MTASLPHGTDREPHGGAAILLTLSAANPNDAAIRFLVESAGLPADMDSYQRVAILFDGEDDRALALRASNGAP